MLSFLFFWLPSQPEPPTAVTEVSAEPPKSPEKKPEKTKMEKDTTSQHKSHLFDLHCKICTGTSYIVEQTALVSGDDVLPMLLCAPHQGRMAPPVEEAPTKVVKVATTVAKRQTTKAEETKGTAPPSLDDDLHLSVLEESLRTAQSGSEGRSVVFSFYFSCHCRQLGSLQLSFPQV